MSREANENEKLSASVQKQQFSGSRNAPRARRARDARNARVPEALLGEIIGERVFVKDASCRELLALKGVVEDETLSTLVIRTDDGALKRVPKKGVVFAFPALECEADGADLLCRPEDRTKKLASKIAKTRK